MARIPQQEDAVGSCVCGWISGFKADSVISSASVALRLDDPTISIGDVEKSKGQEEQQPLGVCRPMANGVSGDGWEMDHAKLCIWANIKVLLCSKYLQVEMDGTSRLTRGSVQTMRPWIEMQSLTLLLFLLSCCQGRRVQHHKWIQSGKFEGDIVGVSMEDFDRQGVMTRSSVKNKHLLWKDAEVPYHISPAYTSHERRIIQQAMEEIEKSSCIRFVPKTDQADHLFIADENGCFSMVGRVKGRQTLSLGAGCLFREVITHELLHALGFWHEQSRTDRDLYIRIRMENVLPGMAGQFRRIDPPYLDYLGETYDYYSIMHYDSRAFSRNGQNTIEVDHDPAVTQLIGKALTLSAKDVRKLNKLYQCPAKENETDADGGQQSGETIESIDDCEDRFEDCSLFMRYCKRFAFRHVMVKHCRKTCKLC